MALDNTASYINELISAGSDVMSNLYKLEFNIKNATENIKKSLEIRSGDFTPPSFSQSVDPKHYMTTSIDMPKSEIQGTKELSFSFRVDQNYEIYTTLLNAQKATSIGNLGFVNTDVNADDFSIIVYSYNGDNGVGDPDATFKKEYKYKYCWIKSINGLSYSYDSSSPLKITVTVGFFDYIDYRMNPNDN